MSDDKVDFRKIDTVPKEIERLRIIPKIVISDMVQTK